MKKFESSDKKENDACRYHKCNSSSSINSKRETSEDKGYNLTIPIKSIRDNGIFIIRLDRETYLWAWSELFINTFMR
jgi:hypothetical protein